MTREQPGQGGRFTLLRDLLGLTQAQLAADLGVRQPFLSKVERGDRPVPESLMRSTCDRFDLPDAFLRVVPQAFEQGQVTFRKLARAGKRDERRVLGLHGEAARAFHAVSLRSGYRPAKLPDPLEYGDDPELAGQVLRAELGLGPADPVLNSIRAVERLGVGVVDRLDDADPDAGGHTGVSRPSRANDRPLIALVSKTPGSVTRMTVMHELGHLVFDRDETASAASTTHELEKRAYRFAGAMLLPADVMRERVSETLNLQAYLRVKADYGVSVPAIVVRARELRVISPSRARSLQIQLSSMGWRHDEPVPVADEQPRLFGQALHRAYPSVADAVADLGVMVRPIGRWLGLTVSPAQVPPTVRKMLSRRHSSGERVPSDPGGGDRGAEVIELEAVRDRRARG